MGEKMNKSEINDLMIKIGNNDDLAFGDLFEKCKKGVFSFLYTYTNDRCLAEDLVQETFIKVKINAGSYKAGTNASAWILQIAKNTALDFLRKNRQTADIDDLHIADTRKDADETLALHDALNTCLEDGDRQIVLLHVVYGYKHREIAKILDIPLGTVLWKYNAALKRLKRFLSEKQI